MGSWNHTCAISNLHITEGEEVVVFMLAENTPKKSFCYNNALYDLCLVPFYGKYNDYGAVEECHGPGLSIVVEAIRSQLYEMGQGPNKYHDCEVRKSDFNEELMFEADLEDRLFIEHFPSSWNQDDYDRQELEQLSELTESQKFELDRLANAISRKVDSRRAVCHVVIHKKIFDYIVKNWYIKKYVGQGQGTKGYNKSYNHIYLKDLLADLPAAIQRIREAHEASIAELEEIKQNKGEISNRLMRTLLESPLSQFEWNDENLAGQWILSMNRDSSDVSYSIVNISETSKSYIGKNDFEGLETFLREALIGRWIDSYMCYIRKPWSKQSGHGSQNNEHVGYQVLANAILEVIKEERAECDMDEEEDGADVS